MTSTAAGFELALSSFSPAADFQIGETMTRDPDWRFMLLAFAAVFIPMAVGQCIAWAQAGEFQNVRIEDWAKNIGIGYRLRQAWTQVKRIAFFFTKVRSR